MKRVIILCTALIFLLSANPVAAQEKTVPKSINLKVKRLTPKLNSQLNSLLKQINKQQAEVTPKQKKAIMRYLRKVKTIQKHLAKGLELFKDGAEALVEEDKDKAIDLFWQANEKYSAAAEILDELRPPRQLRRFHRLTVAAVDDFESGTAMIATGLERDDLEMVQAGAETYGDGNEKLNKAADELERVKERSFTETIRVR